MGESGSGKSVTSLSIMGLIDEPGKIKSGEVLFNGRNLSEISPKQLSDIRGNEIAMIFSGSLCLSEQPNDCH